MSKASIRIDLSEKGIDAAIADVKLYRLKLEQRVSILKEKIAERIKKEAELGFNGAMVDDFINGGKKTANVSLSVEQVRSSLVIKANGEDAVWVEFGAGVYHNNGVGTSPHPLGEELNFTIGSYGKGKGKQTSWGFYEDGDLKISRGTLATMPLYNAMKQVADEIASIAKEVFI